MCQTYARNRQKSVPHFICNITREAERQEEILPSTFTSVTMAL